MPDDHVEDELLGLHHLGELDPAQSDVIHRHLGECAGCRARADEVVETLAALALLSDDAAEAPGSGSEGPGSEGPGDDRSPAHVVARPRGSGRSRADERPASRAGGSGSRPGKPGVASRRARLIRAGGLLALVLVIAGLGLAAIVRGPQPPDGTAVVTAAATATDTTSGASAAVFLTDGDDGVTIRATVSGLRSGTAYVLYAVTSDGESHPVRRWTGTAAVREVTGELGGVHLGELSFFTVSPAAGGVAVSVYLPGVAAAPTPGRTA